MNAPSTTHVQPVRQTLFGTLGLVAVLGGLLLGASYPLEAGMAVALVGIGLATGIAIARRRGRRALNGAPGSARRSTTGRVATGRRRPTPK